MIRFIFISLFTFYLYKDLSLAAYLPFIIQYIRSLLNFLKKFSLGHRFCMLGNKGFILLFRNFNTDYRVWEEMDDRQIEFEFWNSAFTRNLNVIVLWNFVFQYISNNSSSFALSFSLFLILFSFSIDFLYLIFLENILSSHILKNFTLKLDFFYLSPFDSNLFHNSILKK